MMEKPMKAQTADPYKMRCRDCVFRDREVVKANGKDVLIGVMRDTCLIFDGKRGNWKPSNVYFMNDDCLMYERDETV